MSKWNAARAEVAVEDELDAAAEAAAEAPSLRQLEESRRHRVDEWKKGLSAEATQRNSNFQAVAGGDWRERVARRAEREKK